MKNFFTNKFPQLLVFLIPYAFCLVISLSLSSFFGWDADLFYFAWVTTSIVAYFSIGVFSEARVPNGVSQTRKYIVLQLDQLKKQMFLAAILTAATGGLGVFLTAQTIYEADQAQVQFTENRTLLNSLEDAQVARSQMLTIIDSEIAPEKTEILRENLNALKEVARFV